MGIQFHNIKPGELTIWYTDDKEHRPAGWLEETLSEEALLDDVNFEVSSHPAEMKQKLHARVEQNTLTKHNFFISDGAMEFSKTNWQGKPKQTDVRDDYEGSFDVIKGYEPQLLAKGGHYYTTVYSQGMDTNPADFSEVSPDQFKLDMPNSSFTDYGDFQKGINGIVTSRKSEDPTGRFLETLQHFDKLIGLAV